MTHPLARTGAALLLGAVGFLVDARAQTTTPAPVGDVGPLQQETQGDDAATAATTEPPAPPPSATRNCRGNWSSYARYWELDADTDCGNFNIRGYKPISLSWVHGNRVNTAPQSDNDTRDVAAADAQAYERNEMRIQLSVRSKLATGLLFWEPGGPRDSLWFGYTQQSYWQLFNAELSRPFRATDHEPELIYIAPTPMHLFWGWHWSYTGLAINHQSNGQTLPQSRSWNRAILMTGVEKDNRYSLGLRLWQRLGDGDSDSSSDINAQDDNPGIEDSYGRAELMTAWHPNPGHNLVLTLRHNLRPDTERNGLTSWRMEWLRSLDRQAPGLRLHVQIFSGYGDSLIDYNYRRTTFSIGLSLVDF
ncbi:hypothetical protein AZ34_01985 [Hylemonella gracilis str. Niagara R]|uniref:Phospholipase A1 n=1 Tax=Hylemonella gracilis str. Niagara R TaxID=1458275 RepID=A0A016XLN3_9BURK|nr:phospholipase A [Hylemonella gracilis]EYC52751.1 hypothetical protein AZ34_01985 [Hylemonella gracilis str. Niagara R]